MLDENIKAQLKIVFQGLDQDVTLYFSRTTHAKQAELLELLQELSTTSSKIKVSQADEMETPSPEFYLSVGDKKTGVRFIGIPGGHEFSSLVLAILHASGKGKMPDSLLQSRIKRIKGPIEIKTFMSLSCENCPDVVQALNLMSFIHEDFKHTVIDGEYAQDEIKELGIQGVPSVVSRGELITSGKSTLLDLIIKLENFYGTHEASVEKEVQKFDVVVVGSGPAGASAAIYSARKGLRTAIIGEKMGGQVKETRGIENLISVKYTEGPQLAVKLAEHMSEYNIQVLEHRRVNRVSKPHENLSRLELDSGEILETKSLIVATGAKWRELGIPGEKEYLGRGVAFCPHCDGPLFKGKKVAVIGGGNSGVEAAIDLSGLVEHVTVFEYMPELKADKVLVDKLKSLPNITVMTNSKTSRILGDETKVTGLQVEKRSTGELETINLDGIFVQIGLVPNSGFLEGIVNRNKFGEIVIDDKCRTSTPGIYAAGDVTTVPFKQIIIAMGEGAKAGLASFEDLMLRG
jgi:NADH-dependent peroxiredoxin subunit F